MNGESTPPATPVRPALRLLASSDAAGLCEPDSDVCAVPGAEQSNAEQASTEQDNSTSD